MKIRLGFVTNSSSSNFIVSLNDERKGKKILRAFTKLEGVSVNRVDEAMVEDMGDIFTENQYLSNLFKNNIPLYSIDIESYQTTLIEVLKNNYLLTDFFPEIKIETVAW